MKLYRKIISFGVLTVAVLLGLYLLPAPAQAAKEGYYTYEISNGKATITGYEYVISGDVTIPDILGGCPVTAIAPYAFQDCASIVSLTFPKSLTTVGQGAFERCIKLTAVYTPDLTTWLKIAFDGSGANPLENSRCTLYVNGDPLTHLEIPSGFTKIPDYAFAGCHTLTSVTIPDGVTGIGMYAFESCSSLASVKLSPKVNFIDQSAFYSCQKLDAVYITDITAWLNISFVTQSSNPLLSSCGTLYVNGEPLTHLEIPEGFTKVPDYSFAGCTSITSVTFPAGITAIGKYAFYSCSFASITLPSGVTTIGESAFSGCRSLKSITLPDSVTYLDGYAFSDCINLTAVNLSNNLTHLGGYAFNDCTSLVTVTVPNKVTYIGDGAFRSCGSLKLITLPTSLTNIGQFAFYDCLELKTVCYTGSKQQWNKITIKTYNDNLTIATILYNHIHNYTSVTVSPTCTDSGYTEYTCANGHSYKIELYSLGHDLSVVSVTPATCTENGYTYFICNRCGVEQRGDTVWKLGHNMVTTPAVAPGCTLPGLTAGRKCDRCSLVKVEQQAVAAVGHVYVDGICTRCAYDLTEDEIVTDADAVYLLRHTLFPEDYPVAKTVDFNADGILSDADAVYLLRYTLFPEDYPLFPKTGDA